MKARDIMTAKVVCVNSSTPVKDAARLILKHRISAAPVVNDAGRLLGILSEGDRLHRDEAATERQRPWWLRAFTSGEALARDFTEAHAERVEDVMTRSVVTAPPEATIAELAALMEDNGIKRIRCICQIPGQKRSQRSRRLSGSVAHRLGPSRLSPSIPSHRDTACREGTDACRYNICRPDSNRAASVQPRSAEMA